MSNQTLTSFFAPDGTALRRLISRPAAWRRATSILAVALLSSAVALPQTLERITLQQAVRIALEHNADVLLAALEQDKARQAVVEARAPFTPQVFAGSGLAYTNGIPQSVEGSTPAVVQVLGRQFLYNSSQSNRIKQAREMAGAAGHAAAGKQEEVAFRVAATYLDFEHAWRRVKLLEEQVEHLAQVERTIAERVAEGRLLPLDLSRARLETARSSEQFEAQRAQAELLEATLKHELNFEDDRRLAPAPGGTVTALPLPETLSAARSRALANSSELKSLGAKLRANDYELLAEKGALRPRIDLVAQYSLLSRFNNYEEFFNRFQRHNGQIGMSFQIPIFAGKTVSARVGKVALEARDLHLRQAAAASRVKLEAQRLFQQVEQAERVFKLTRQELDFARENLTVQLALFDEGHASLEEVERARILENQAWGAYYEGQYSLQKAKLDLLRQTGELVAALR